MFPCCSADNIKEALSDIPVVFVMGPRQRQVELFFKWIKQNLKIKTFLGTSKNAVLSQIWVAMIYTLLLAYIKFQTSFSGSILNLSRIIQEALFFRQHLIDLLGLNSPDPPEKQDVFQLSFC